LILEIRDSGKGFESEIAEQLFERDMTTSSSGTGLTMHNCREIIESHAGSMAITSEGPGKGALTRIQFKARIEHDERNL
jgi:nitrogen fixation/metabolism regulation signal transduction histidine kinase